MPVSNATVTSLFLFSASFILYSLTVLQCTVYETPYFEPSVSLIINLSTRIWKLCILKILVSLYRQNLISVLVNISVGMYNNSYTKARNSSAICLMFVDLCIVLQFIKKNQQDAPMYQIFIIPCLYEAQRVSGDTPPSIRSPKLHWQPLVFHTRKVVGRVDGGRCEAQCVWQRIKCIKSRCISYFRTPVMFCKEVYYSDVQFGLFIKLLPETSPWRLATEEIFGLFPPYFVRFMTFLNALGNVGGDTTESKMWNSEHTSVVQEVGCCLIVMTLYHKMKQSRFRHCFLWP
jgi:hypothetical protein